MRKTRIVVAFLLVATFLLAATTSFAEEVAHIKAAIVARQARWHAGKTSMTSLSSHERVARLGLVMPTMQTSGEGMLTAEPPLVGAPASRDWRNNGGNFVTPVRNQGGCGSCWAFATTAALESLILRVNNTPGVDLNLSEQVLVSCGNSGSCGGGYISTASSYIRDTGLPLETCSPYTGTDGSCSTACASYNTSTYRIQGWSWVTTSAPTVDAIRNALNTYGPLVTTMQVYNDFFSYTSGVYSYTSGSLAGGHAVLIVGYDDVGQYFIVKNSWGTGWGEGGLFRIAYSELNTAVKFGQYTISYSGSACTYSISPASQSFTASGGSGSVSVATQAGCPWSVSNNAAWITITAGSNGTGSGTATYSVSSNSGSGSRSSVLTIAGQSFTVSESGQPACTYSISPASQSFTASGGNGTVTVTTQAGCTWSASESSSWIAITAGSSGTGSGTVAYSVSSNSGSSSRSSVLSIAGQSFTVDESGQTPICTYSISPANQSFSASGGSGTVNVTTQAGCTWSASENSSWIAITAGSSGTGPGAVTYSVSSNSGSSSRSDLLTVAGQTFTVSESGQAPPAISNSHDFNGDGKPDLIWQNQSTGQLKYWLMNGTAYSSSDYLFNGQGVDTNWKIVGIGDFNADGKPDLIWQNQSTGQLSYWLMNGLTLQSYDYLFNGQAVDTNWKIVGIGDFNADGKPDLIGQNQSTGQLYYWLMNGLTLQSHGYLFNGQGVVTNWKIVGIGDFNADGKPDLIWQNQSTGQLSYWLMNGLTLQSYDYLYNGQAVDTNWKIVGVFDLDGDGKPDLIWQNQSTGQLSYWLMNGVTLQSQGYLFNGQAMDTNWKIVGK